MTKNTGGYRYTPLQNITYILAGAHKWQPVIMPCMAIQAFCEGLIGFVWLYGAKEIISFIEHPDPANNSFINIAWVVMSAALIELILMIGKNISSKQIEARVTDVRGHFILMVNQKVLTMPFKMTEDPQVLNAIEKTFAATNNMVEGIEGIVKKSATWLTRLVIMAVAAVVLLRLSPLLVAIMFILALIRGRIQDKVMIWSKEKVIDFIVPKYREAGYYRRTASNFDYAKDIRIYGMENPLREKQEKTHAYIHEGIKKLENKWLVTWIKLSGIDFIQEGIMYAWLIYAVLKNGMSVADFTLYAGSIRSFNYAMAEFLQSIVEIGQDSRYICDYRIFLEYPEDSDAEPEKSTFKKDYRRIMKGEAAKEDMIAIPQCDTYEFTFDHVSFRYPGSKQDVLKDINITLEASKRLAVVGLNGAGKSTFIKLLCRMYEPTEGVIYMNGINIARFDKEEYYKLLSPVFQTVECFAFSIQENVSLKEDTDKKLALQSLEDAGLGSKMKSLEKGLDTQMLKFLHVDGVDLSGGEKQKLGLARALYKNAPVVVLDEPTSALDALAEYKTYMDFDRLIGDKTAVYISHRLSSTRFCHRIAMFAEGRIVEYGTHEELMAAGGPYADMFAIQAQYYKEEVS